MHKKGIIYRDLKPENVLLGSDGYLKITDFGLSKEGIESGRKTYTFCGTPEYLAPEIIRGLGHDKTVDYWTLGALLYDMLSGSPPFYSSDREKMFRNILEKPLEIRPYFSAESTSILKGLLTVNPNKRLSNPEEIRAHPFFQGIDWTKLNKREIKPVFLPKLAHDRDLRYFDRMFTDYTMGDTTEYSTRELNHTQNTYQGFTYNGELMKNHDHS